jgi:hypothetical protein
MGYATLAAALAIALIGAEAAVTTLPLPVPVPDSPGQVTVCVSPAGGMMQGAVTCRHDRNDKIINCQCPAGGTARAAWLCRPGEKPPAETPAVTLARHNAALRGDLVDAKFEGRRLCVGWTGRGPSFPEDSLGGMPLPTSPQP